MNYAYAMFLSLGIFIGLATGLMMITLQEQIDEQPQEKLTSNELEMGKILKRQMEIGNVVFSCDIDFLTQYHDKPICLSELDVITPTDLGYILHGNITSGHMWMQDGELIKIRGTNGLTEVEYNGTVNKITIVDTDYYLITNAVMQGNHN